MCIGTTYKETNASSLHDVKDILHAMEHQESTSYRCIEYLYDADCGCVNETRRRQMCQWMFTIVDHWGYDRKVVAVAATYVDLCLSKHVVRSSSNKTKSSSFPTNTETSSTQRSCPISSSPLSYQLAIVAALHLAVKVHITAPKLRMNKLVELSRGKFNEQDIIKMEQHILQELSWKLHPPTSMCFLFHYEQILSVLSKSCQRRYMISRWQMYTITEMSRFILELCVCKANFIKHPQSIAAYASMLIAFDVVERYTASINQGRDDNEEGYEFDYVQHQDLMSLRHQQQQFCSSVETMVGLHEESIQVSTAKEDLEVLFNENADINNLIDAILKQYQADMDNAAYESCNDKNNSSCKNNSNKRKQQPYNPPSPREVAFKQLRDDIPTVYSHC